MAGVTLITALASCHCASMRETRSETRLSKSIERVAERRDERSGVGWFKVRAEGGSARIEWLPSCSIVQTEHLIVREDIQRSPDTGVLVLEIVTATVGATLLAYSFSDGKPSMGESSCTASDPPQCESKSGTTGAAFIGGMPLLLVGGISAAVALASKRRETRIRHTTVQVPSAQPVPCRQHRTAGISAALVVGENQYSGRFDTAGVAIIPVPESVWEQHPEGIKATLLLDGVAAGQVLLAPGVRTD